MLDRVEAFREWAGEVSGREVSEGALDSSVRVYNENRRAFELFEERMAESPGFFRGRDVITSYSIHDTKLYETARTSS